MGWANVHKHVYDEVAWPENNLALYFTVQHCTAPHNIVQYNSIVLYNIVSTAYDGTV